MFTTTMLRPPILPYSKIVTLLESYAEWHNLDAQPTPQMVFYGQRRNKNRKIMEGKYHSIAKDVALLKVTKLLLRPLIPHSPITSQLVVRMRFLSVRSATNGIIQLLSALIDSTIHSLQMISQKHLQL